METKQIAIFLIIAGIVILVLKSITEIIKWVMGDTFIAIGLFLLVGGAILLALKFLKENRDDAKDEPFRGIKQ